MPHWCIFANVYIRVRSKKSNKGELWSEIRWAQFFSENNRKTSLHETSKPHLMPPSHRKPRNQTPKHPATIRTNNDGLFVKHSRADGQDMVANWTGPADI